MSNEDYDYLERISNYLIINSSYLDNIGLLRGKMGIVIFFYHYSLLTNNKLYKNIAEDLIDDIYQDMHKNSQINFENGICGIGWGFQYLIINNFVEAVDQDVFRSFDELVLSRNIYWIHDCSLNKGLAGIAYYILIRSYYDPYNIFIKSGFINQLYNKLICASNVSDTLVISLKKVIDKKKLDINDYDILSFLINEAHYQHNNVFDYSQEIGILNNGITGIGLKILQR